MTERRVVWFSAGAPSAVLAKLEPDAVLAYCATNAEHPDNVRFIREVSEWCERPVEILTSERYADTWDVWDKRGYILGHHGAPCTVELKKKLRYAFQYPTDIQMFGFHVGEEGRAADVREREPGIEWEFPLIDRGITREDCLAIIDRAGIALPWMYLHGYQHNNCMACPKAGMGHWNAVRVDFPEDFARMAALERKYDFATHHDKHGPIFLDELDPDRGDRRTDPKIDCSIICAITEVEIRSPAPDTPENP